VTVVVPLVVAGHLTNQLVEVEAHLVEIAAVRERAERTIPPKWWMD